ncbi:ABC transporter permease [Mameliella sediminis]|uniref:ABC transporter permease n=1 Tax=Mameliella sediminis TaxID=2836866 RepID=UPI001C483999|nr:ABC transporter permease subunit [Mameliella sediminis]MBY6114547.1 ABC transporter permease subunit [Antarctobacter heliothermus]MBY6144120.1 ABC transporter permease subunit [Mameliella alba]MBV7392972.1 ABC transporter permease subunit [Mameliella sediminis]MBY6161588.1 ABC transporter permease subunit [Mameliella alba]MBY6169946.1 ABC transporter permease subunit [Mameliella alba]
MRWINRRPGPVLATVLAALPFVAVLAAYMIGSDMRLAVNPSDKLLPAPTTILATAERLLTEPDRRSGEILFWLDTWASLQRLFLGVAIASSLALVVGMVIGMLPYLRSTFAAFVAVLSMVPPLAILPILFIMLGLGEVSKVALIVIGIGPFLIRDMSQRVLDLPREQFVKAQTLGASSMAIGLQVVLPQVLPRLIGSLRLSLGPAWLFLIAAEAIAADQGLGYRIFLVRRYLAMDVILTYVAWITLLAYLLDFALRQVSRRAFPWDGEAL